MATREEEKQATVVKHSGAVSSSVSLTRVRLNSIIEQIEALEQEEAQRGMSGLSPRKGVQTKLGQLNRKRVRAEKALRATLGRADISYS